MYAHLSQDNILVLLNLDSFKEGETERTLLGRHGGSRRGCMHIGRGWGNVELFCLFEQEGNKLWEEGGEDKRDRMQTLGWSALRKSNKRETP